MWAQKIASVQGLRETLDAGASRVSNCTLFERGYASMAIYPTEQ
jgi:hypothetical protein